MTQLPDTKSLILDLDEGWLTLWFNTPENRNALSAELAAELVAVLNSVRDDRTVRGITLRGKGGVFCSGADLKGLKAGFHDGQKDTYQSAARMSRGAGEMFDLISTMPQVVIVLVEGAAMGGGLGIVCCADVVAVTREAEFSLSETTLGISPAQIAPFVVQRLGLKTARRLMLTAARFNGAQAAAIGLADFLVDDSGGFEDIEAAIRKDVKRCAPNANAVTKAILLATPHLDREAMIDLAANEFARCMMSEEGREGIASFVEKRKPKWAE